MKRCWLLVFAAAACGTAKTSPKTCADTPYPEQSAVRDLRFEGVHRPDLVFHGLGPRTLQANRTRYGLDKLQARPVFFLCVVLGFKGAYDAAPGLELPLDIGIPETMEEWLRKTRNWIKLSPVKVSERRPVGVEHDASPLIGKYQLLGMVMACVVTTSLASLVVFIFLNLRESRIP